ncbi:uncharacterized protein METZ01_LOCUS257046 [marine metagenome]|uniref:Uncharacterized protein n=1 Tax=marine metagenome TaxID=408172 RepID=A0A382IYF3_9ZZZZ
MVSMIAIQSKRTMMTNNSIASTV